MKEIAFTVNPDSELYANHFIQKAEKKRFAELASAFLNAHFPGEGNNSIMLGKRLEVKLSPETEEKFRSQLLKYKDSSGFSMFKAKSTENQCWHEEVISKVDLKKYEASRFWWMDFPGVGHLRTSLWDDGNGNVYGYYCSEFYSDKGTIPDYATEIKLSEYYAAVEAYEAEVKAK